MPEPLSDQPLLDGAALVTRLDRGVIRVAGADRATWLQGLLTNDVESLAPGRGCYAAWLTPQGRMITDVVALAEDDAISLEVPGSLAVDVYRRLDAAIFAEDVQLTDEDGVWATLGVHGARAAEVVARALVGSRPSITVDAATLASWGEYANAALGHTGRVMRLDLYGVPGFALRVETASRDLWLSRLRLAGATPVPAGELEFARIEAGRPEFLVDMDADTIPLEAGIEDRAISFTKGCYVGQEVIVRVVHRGGGRVARRLVGLRLDGSTVPVARAPVMSGARQVGEVTSAAWSPVARAPVALAIVHRDFVQPGTALEVHGNGALLPATVTALPMAFAGPRRTG